MSTPEGYEAQEVTIEVGDILDAFLLEIVREKLGLKEPYGLVINTNEITIPILRAKDAK